MSPLLWPQSNSGREQMAMIMRARRASAVAAEAGEVLPALIDRANASPSQPPLSTALRAAEQVGLGDRSGVQIHTGPEAAAAADAASARALTVGKHIHFGAGEYDPFSAAGQELLGHELTHTAQQQDSSAVVQQAKPRLSEPQDSAEQEAERLGQAQGQAWRDLAAGATVPLARSDLAVRAAVPTGSVSRVPKANQVPSEESEAVTESGEVDTGRPTDGDAGPSSESEAGDAGTGALGLSDMELRWAAALIQQQLDSAAQKTQPGAAQQPQLAPKKSEERDEVEVWVPLDRSMLELGPIRRTFHIRCNEAAIKALGGSMSRGDIAMMVDAAMRHFGAGETVIRGGRPSDLQLRQAIERIITKGTGQILVRVRNTRKLLEWYDGYTRQRVREIREFKEAMANSTYAQDAIVSFYTAHANAVIEAFNGLSDLAWATSGPSAVLQNRNPVHIPKIPYTGEYGQKYGQTMETGASAGLFLISAAPVASIIGKAGAAVGTSFEGISISGVNIGPHLVKASKLVLAGATVKAGYDFTKQTIADFELLASEEASSAEKDAALERIVLGLAGVAVGAGSRDQAVKSRRPAGRGRIPPARVERGDVHVTEHDELAPGPLGRPPDREAQRPYHPRRAREEMEDTYGPENVDSGTVPPASGKNVKLAGDRHPTTEVAFDVRGFPIFDDGAAYATRLPESVWKVPNRKLHMTAATQHLNAAMEAGVVNPSKFTPEQLAAIRAGKAKIPGYTWHHHQDKGKMQLVPADEHRDTGHVGGFDTWYEEETK